MSLIRDNRGKPKCAGPIYLADQGIPVCHVCGECTCCDDKRDHAEAEWDCIVDDDGDVCHLVDHADRECAKPKEHRP